ncbi:hypothetical protein TRFO_30963 [Tritrichomonas foetus]|uniref:RRM domain-containing protein n=1 Tax=Tritrichomonas foetus TaxID=1144522 RepID=A0A1J4JSI2_9EUKA|nr:hypothetical protein TRFO_30963 [Tritrichomonas foetus]|eukprot:OHT02011.1 hypothetical protein TRFO_30963 [Tritrichomonas foetus]
MQSITSCILQISPKTNIRNIKSSLGIHFTYINFLKINSINFLFLDYDSKSDSVNIEEIVNRTLGKEIVEQTLYSKRFQYQKKSQVFSIFIETKYIEPDYFTNLTIGGYTIENCSPFLSCIKVRALDFIHLRAYFDCFAPESNSIFTKAINLSKIEEIKQIEKYYLAVLQYAVRMNGIPKNIEIVSLINFLSDYLKEIDILTHSQTISDQQTCDFSFKTEKEMQMFISKLHGSKIGGSEIKIIPFIQNNSSNSNSNSSQIIISNDKYNDQEDDNSTSASTSSYTLQSNAQQDYPIYIKFPKDQAPTKEEFQEMMAAFGETIGNPHILNSDGGQFIYGVVRFQSEDSEKALLSHKKFKERARYSHQQLILSNLPLDFTEKDVQNCLNVDTSSYQIKKLKINPRGRFGIPEFQLTIKNKKAVIEILNAIENLRRKVENAHSLTNEDDDDETEYYKPWKLPFSFISYPVFYLITNKRKQSVRDLSKNQGITISKIPNDWTIGKAEEFVRQYGYIKIVAISKQIEAIYVTYWNPDDQERAKSDIIENTEFEVQETNLIK